MNQSEVRRPTHLELRIPSMNVLICSLTLSKNARVNQIFALALTGIKLGRLRSASELSALKQKLGDDLRSRQMKEVVPKFGQPPKNGFHRKAG